MQVIFIKGSSCTADKVALGFFLVFRKWKTNVDKLTTSTAWQSDNLRCRLQEVALFYSRLQSHAVRDSQHTCRHGSGASGGWGSAWMCIWKSKRSQVFQHTLCHLGHQWGTGSRFKTLICSSPAFHSPHNPPAYITTLLGRDLQEAAGCLSCFCLWRRRLHKERRTRRDGRNCVGRPLNLRNRKQTPRLQRNLQVGRER